MMNLEIMKSTYVGKRQIPLSDDPGDYIFKTRFGFLVFDNNRLSYYAQLQSKRAKNFHLRKIKAQNPDFTVTQEGDQEFIGSAKLGSELALIAATRPRKHGPRPTNAFQPKPKI